MSYTTFRNHLASALDKVNENHTPVLVTRQNGDPAVVLSLDDFKSYEETAYLMSSTKNTQRLSQSIEQLESGKGAEKGLIES
ncbi:MAG: type II toxin-antitoxin system prevent-host-death family antitoxin [Mariprofundaceae bacterium]|nr:type II toxin-antitoxin system prevent-host-death family antitoxin [Mariprofundaceae bacterium]